MTSSTTYTITTPGRPDATDIRSLHDAARECGPGAVLWRVTTWLGGGRLRETRERMEAGGWRWVG